MANNLIIELKEEIFDEVEIERYLDFKISDSSISMPFSIFNFSGLREFITMYNQKVFSSNLTIDQIIIEAKKREEV